jgi:hypothetical protein
MESIKWWARNGEAVRQAIELGELVHMETASEELTDAFFLLAIESGLLQTWAGAFPAPRNAPEIGMEVMLPAHMAGRFAGLYSLRKTGYVRRSARVLGALGSSVEVVAPEHGLAVRGTADDKLLSGDVVRQLLGQMAQQVDLSQPMARPAKEPRVRVKGRERASRRAVKQTVDEGEAEARALKVAEPWIGWYNQHVGISMLQYARLARGDGCTSSIRPRWRWPERLGGMRAAVWSKTLTRHWRVAISWPRCGPYSIAPVCGARWLYRRSRCVVGVFIAVPVMLMPMHICQHTQAWFPPHA